MRPQFAVVFLVPETSSEDQIHNCISKRHRRRAHAPPMPFPTRKIFLRHPAAHLLQNKSLLATPASLPNRTPPFTHEKSPCVTPRPSPSKQVSSGHACVSPQVARPVHARKISLRHPPHLLQNKPLPATPPLSPIARPRSRTKIFLRHPSAAHAVRSNTITVMLKARLAPSRTVPITRSEWSLNHM